MPRREFRQQKVTVHRMIDGKMERKALVEADNSIDAFDKVWAIIGNNKRITGSTRFMFKHYNIGERTPFKQVLRSKFFIGGEIERNQREMVTPYASTLPDDGKFVYFFPDGETGEIKRDDIAESELRNIAKDAAYPRPNLYIEAMVEKGVVHVMGAGYVAWVKEGDLVGKDT